MMTILLSKRLTKSSRQRRILTVLKQGQVLGVLFFHLPLQRAHKSQVIGYIKQFDLQIHPFFFFFFNF